MFGSPELDTTTSKYPVLLISAIALLAFVALGLSMYLTWSTWQSDTVLGCTGSSLVNCDAVLSSHWSQWLGLPVSLFGAFTYVAILAVAWPASKRPQAVAGSCLLALSLSAAGAAIWFTGVQIFVIKSFCLFCMGVHVCGLAISVLAILLVRDASAKIDYEQMRTLLGVRNCEETPTQSDNGQAWNKFYPSVAMGVASVILVLLIGGQLLFSPPTLLVENVDAEEAVSFEKEEPEDLSFAPAKNVANDEEASLTKLPEPVVGSTTRLVRVAGLQNAIDISEYPILGNPDAPVVLVEMMDYTCTHCRHLHPFILAALDRYGDQLAFIIYHVPLSRRCNPHVKKDYPGKSKTCDLVRMAMSVAKLTPDRFAEFHLWLMEPEKPPSAGETRLRAMDLAGEGVLIDDRLRQNIAKKILEHCDALATNKGGLPMVLTQHGTLRGLPKNKQVWFQVLEEQLGLKPMAKTAVHQ